MTLLSRIGPGQSMHSISLLPFNSGGVGGGGGGAVPDFKKVGSEKNECLGGRVKEFLPWIFAWGCLLCLLSKKDF